MPVFQFAYENVMACRDGGKKLIEEARLIGVDEVVRSIGDC